MKKVIRTVDLRDQDAITDVTWSNTTAEERFRAVEAIRRAAWELYGKPDHGLERVLRVVSFPQS